MQQVRYYYPGQKPYRMVYCEDPFGNIVETLQPLLRADLFGRRLRLRTAMAPLQGRHHRLRLRRYRRSSARSWSRSAREVVGMQARARRGPGREARDCDAIMQPVRPGRRARRSPACERCKVIARYGDRRRHRRRRGGDEQRHRSSPMCATTAPRRSPTTRSRCGSRWPASSAEYDRRRARADGTGAGRAGAPAARRRSGASSRFGRIGQAIAASAPSLRRRAARPRPLRLGRRLATFTALKSVDKDELLARAARLMMQVPMTARDAPPDRRERLARLIKPGPSGQHRRAARPSTTWRSTTPSSSGRSRAPPSTTPRRSRPSASTGPRPTIRSSRAQCLITPHVAYVSEAALQECRASPPRTPARC